MAVDELFAIQSDFSISVNTWGNPGKVTLETVINRRDWYGSADVNVSAEDLIVDGVKPIAIMEFDRYLLTYRNWWSDPSEDRKRIRFLAQSIDQLISMALVWLGEHPEYSLTHHTPEQITAFQEEQRKKDNV
jgi:hypothetical protein